MIPADKEKLRAFWASRALVASREAFISSGGEDILFLVLQAALLPIPLFETEPFYQRPTPVQSVGGIIDEEGFVRVNVIRPTTGDRLTAVRVCSARDMVDNLERLADALKFSDFEYVCMLDKVRKWITHDDREGEQNMRHDHKSGENIAEMRRKAQAMSDSWHKTGKRSGRQPRTRH